MKKRIIVIVAGLALLTLTAASTAAADVIPFGSGSGVLVRQNDDYMITGTLRDADSRVVGTVHGTLIEQTTGFNACPDIYFFCSFGISPTCNLLGGNITLNFHGKKYEAEVFGDISGRFESSLCQDPDDPTSYRLIAFAWSSTHVPPGAFPDLFVLGGSVQQVSPKVFTWTSL